MDKDAPGSNVAEGPCSVVSLSVVGKMTLSDKYFLDSPSPSAEVAFPLVLHISVVDLAAWLTASSTRMFTSESPTDPLTRTPHPHNQLIVQT